MNMIAKAPRFGDIKVNSIERAVNRFDDKLELQLSDSDLTEFKELLALKKGAPTDMIELQMHSKSGYVGFKVNDQEFLTYRTPSVALRTLQLTWKLIEKAPLTDQLKTELKDKMLGCAIGWTAADAASPMEEAPTN